MRPFVRSSVLRALVVVALSAVAAPHARAQVAVRGARVHTLAGPVIEDGVVLVRDGRIAAVGRRDEVTIPEGFRVLEAAVVTPGLVDARSVVGLAGQLNQPRGRAHDQDQLESSAPVQPELRALDAYNPHERLIEWVRGFGVTTLHTGHAPGELISGQTIVVKTIGNTVESALLKSPGAVAATLGPSSLKDGGSTPGTRAKQVALLRARLVAAQEYAAARAAPDPEKPATRDLALEALGKVLAGEVPLVVTAQRAQDIASALRLEEEFGFRLIVDGGAESYLLAERLRAAEVPVILHPPMARAVGELENASFETPARLRDGGVRFAFQSGYEPYVPKTRIVLFEAAIAAANGLSFEEALAAITIDAARLLGIESRVGSIAVGKDGDLALYDGDPFEYTTHCVATVIEGRVVHESPR